MGQQGQFLENVECRIEAGPVGSRVCVGII